MTLYGYMGKILRVNLTTGEIREEPLPEKMARDYIGATGFGIKILYDEVDPTVDPLSPENKLIFATGPLQATVIPFSGRYEVSAKSPLTGIFGGSNSGGAFGPYMKRTGYDVLIFEGKAEKPVYVYITDHGVTIHDAGKIWGLDSYETDDAIKDELDDPRVRIACIGQAGEQLIRFASVMNEQGRAAGRSGMGAVMGSKNLKAIVVYGEKEVTVAQPEKLLNVVKGLMKVTKGNPIVPMFADYGTQVFLDTFIPVGDVPFKYWTDPGTVEHGAKIGGVALKKKYLTKNIHCVTCPIGCGRYVKTEGKYGIEGHGPEYESGGAFGSLCMLEDLVAMCKANDMCNRYGIDTIEGGSMVAFTMMCYDKGILTEKEIGYPVKWGDPDATIQLLDDILNRRGPLGDLFAEGIVPTTKKLGKDTDKFAIHVKGQHLAMHDPRNFSGLVLSYATTERGACHCRGMGWIELAGGAMIPGYGISTRHDRHELEKKVISVKATQDLSNNLGGLTLCLFSMMGLMLPKLQLDLANIVTGFNYTEKEFVDAGERMFNLKRVFSTPAGTSRKDDTLPELISMPGGTEGWTPTQEQKDKVLDEYYDARGWTRNGIPTRKKLAELDIELRKPYEEYITE